LVCDFKPVQQSSKSIKNQKWKIRNYLMPITEKDVTYVADLANLELTPEERSRFAKELSSILEYIGRLNELDTADVPPMAQISAEKSQFASAMRGDELRPSLPHEAAMRNPPDSDGSFFKVPKVIEK
jgi:aspartyl-tRNA(Asn)/glutamyl-tRNA(Gln) amidotransferase subunit C